MLNLIQLQDRLKDLSDRQLAEQMQMGSMPQYLVLSEMQRRQKMRGAATTNEPPQATVADDLIQGVATLPVEPPAYASGGLVSFADGGPVNTRDVIEAYNRLIKEGREEDAALLRKSSEGLNPMWATMSPEDARGYAGRPVGNYPDTADTKGVWYQKTLEGLNRMSLEDMAALADNPRLGVSDPDLRFQPKPTPERAQGARAVLDAIAAFKGGNKGPTVNGLTSTPTGEMFRGAPVAALDPVEMTRPAPENAVYALPPAGLPALARAPSSKQLASGAPSGAPSGGPSGGPSDGPVVHTVKKGETIYSIAKDTGVPRQKLMADNGVTNPRKLAVGTRLVLDTQYSMPQVASAAPVAPPAEKRLAGVATLPVATTSSGGIAGPMMSQADAAAYQRMIMERPATPTGILDLFVPSAHAAGTNPPKLTSAPPAAAKTAAPIAAPAAWISPAEFAESTWDRPSKKKGETEYHWVQRKTGRTLSDADYKRMKQAYDAGRPQNLSEVYKLPPSMKDVQMTTGLATVPAAALDVVQAPVAAAFNAAGGKFSLTPFTDPLVRQPLAAAQARADKAASAVALDPSLDREGRQADRSLRTGSTPVVTPAAPAATPGTEVQSDKKGGTPTGIAALAAPGTWEEAFSRLDKLKRTPLDTTRFENVLADLKDKYGQSTKNDTWMAIAKAGFAMAAGSSPHAMQNMAAGMGVGIEQLMLSKKEARALDRELATAENELAKAIHEDNEKGTIFAAEKVKAYSQLVNWKEENERKRDENETAASVREQTKWAAVAQDLSAQISKYSDLSNLMIAQADTPAGRALKAEIDRMKAEHREAFRRAYGVLPAGSGAAPGFDMAAIDAAIAAKNKANKP